MFSPSWVVDDEKIVVAFWCLLAADVCVVDGTGPRAGDQLFNFILQNVEIVIPKMTLGYVLRYQKS